MDRYHGKLATVIGGSGFIGTQIVQLLAHEGYRVRVAVRRPDLANHLRTQGVVGQIQPIQVNVRYPESIARGVHAADVVINLVGVGHERGPQRFAAVHVDGARAVAEAARAAGVPRLVHMSAIGADPESASAYARSKGLGEVAVLAAFPGAVIMRPSVVFGQGDSFFNRLAGLARMLPVLPLIGGRTRFQPVYVGDVADAFAAAARGDGQPGQVYELGGPEIETQRQIMERILRETGRSNPLLPVPAGIAKALALPLSLLPTPILTGDQVVLLHQDNLVSEEAIAAKRTLAGFGIVPTPMDAVLHTYLWRFNRNGQFARQNAHGTIA